MMTNLVGGVFDLLGRVGSSRKRAATPEDDEADASPDGYSNQFSVPIGRAEPDVAAGDDTATRAGRILDRNMNYSPDPRTGRVPRGIYRGKTAPEAALAARREAEGQARNNIGGGDVGRIGSDRLDYQGGGTGFGVPLNRVSSGLDRQNATVRAAQQTAARRASGDMRGVSFWRNNGDGTSTSGSYGADNKATSTTSDIVPRVRPGQTVVAKQGTPLPKGTDKNTHLIFEDTKRGTKIQGARTYL